MNLWIGDCMGVLASAGDSYSVDSLQNDFNLLLMIPYWIRFNSYRYKDSAESTKSSRFSFLIL